MKKSCYSPNDYFEYATIPAKDLVSSQPYQRTINKRHIKGIMDDFDPYQVNPIKVAFRNGRYYVFDGQHTLSTLICLFGMDVLVPVMVFKQITYEVEAGLFADQDKHKKRLKKEERLVSLYEKKDPNVMLFKDYCERFGYECDFAPSTKDGKISSYSYLFDKVLVAKGEDRFARVLLITTKAYGANGKATNSYVLRAINCFLDHYEDAKNPSLRESILIKALKSLTPESIRDNGRKDNTRTGDERFVAQLVVAYNKILRKNTADHLNLAWVSSYK